MMTINMTAGNDNQLIWFVVIKTDDYTFRFATETKVLTNTYDGGVMWNYGISDVRETVGLGSGGSIGAKSTFRFLIARYNSGTNTDDFFNEFYPATSGRVLTNREVNIGFAWSGITADSQITWLKKYFIKDYEYDPSVIEIYCVEKREYELREIPYYKVQKDWDNGVSYFTNAPDENYGSNIPIVYGDFSIYEDDQQLFKPRLLPVVCVDKHQLKFICGSHKFYSNLWTSGGSSLMWQYINNVDGSLYLECANGSGVNNNIKAYLTNFDTLDSVDNIIYGTLNIHPVYPGSKNDLTDYANTIDGNDSTSAVVIYPNELSTKLKGNGSLPGTLSRAANSIKLKFYVITANPGGSNIISATYWNPEYNSGVGGYGSGAVFSYTSGVELKEYDLSSDFASRDTTDEAWRFEELLGLEYRITVTSGQTVSIRDLWLSISNIIINDPRMEARVWGTVSYTSGNILGRYRTETLNKWVNAWRINKDLVKIPENVFVRGAGRMFDRWIDTAGSRTAGSTGYIENGLIANPAYVIESVLRDECFIERDLRVTSKTSRNVLTCSTLKGTVDNYYQNAIIRNATLDDKDYVTASTASTDTLTISGSGAEYLTNNNFFLSNVQGDAKIYEASFDKIGNTTDGLRKNWVFGHPINTAQPAQNILEQLCFESHCILIDTYEGFKLIALDEEDASVDTWIVPLNRDGRELIKFRLSDIDDIYTDFRLKYHYDYGKGTYTKEFFVNKDIVSTDAVYLGATEKAKCAAAETDYKIKKYFEYSADWIYNDATAEYFLIKLVNWLTKQYSIIEWVGQLSTYAKYEVGDQVKINFQKMLPTGKNNTAKFMVYDKKIDPNPQDPKITLGLIEVGSGIRVIGYGSLYGSGYGQRY